MRLEPTRCKSWKKYKGIRRPICNNGQPCEVCISIYKKTQRELRQAASNGRRGR